MTMPLERMRALRWGAELLALMSSDDTVPESMRARVDLLLQAYPASSALEVWIISGGGGLPTAWAAVIAAAGEVFTELRFEGHGSVETRQALRYTLRHFPDALAVGAMEVCPTLREWLWPEHVEDGRS